MVYYHQRQTNKSEAGAAARVWLRLREVFGLDRDFVCACVRERDRD